MISTLFLFKIIVFKSNPASENEKNIQIEQAAGNGQEATRQGVGTRDPFPTG